MQISLQERKEQLKERLRTVRNRESTRIFLDWRLANNSNKTNIEQWKKGIGCFVENNGNVILDVVNNLGTNTKQHR